MVDVDDRIDGHGRAAPDLHRYLGVEDRGQRGGAPHECSRRGHVLEHVREHDRVELRVRREVVHGVAEALHAFDLPLGVVDDEAGGTRGDQR